jgi:hypothetical protein
VTITGKGFITQNITTGPDETGQRYQEIIIQPKQTCIIQGDAVVLYYKRRTVGPPPQASPPQITRSKDSDISSTGCASPVEIVVRLHWAPGRWIRKIQLPIRQISSPAKSHNYGILLLVLNANHMERFSHSPPCLKFTFKDAMPSPKATEVSRGNEDHLII